MSRFLFYLWDCAEHDRLAPPENVGLRLNLWKPGLDAARQGVPWVPVAVYSALHHLRIFKNREVGLLTVHRNDQLLHHAAAYPGYFRFPFMHRNDMQIGLLWTRPDARGKGLAALGVQFLLHALYQSKRRIWYVVALQNGPSKRVARKCGFGLVGEGCQRIIWRPFPTKAYYVDELPGPRGPQPRPLQLRRSSSSLW